jgi:hypothetical protein
MDNLSIDCAYCLIILSNVEQAISNFEVFQFTSTFDIHYSIFIIRRKKTIHFKGDMIMELSQQHAVSIQLKENGADR